MLWKARRRVELYDNRLIAFLDVLGFRKMIESQELAEVYRSYSSWIDEAQAVFSRYVPKETGQFAHHKFVFDSIVLLSKPIDVRTTADFLLSTIFLFESGFKYGFPLRGCIGAGSMIVDEARGVFLSKEIPGLLKAEKDQEWSGISILPTAEKAVLENFFGDHVPSPERSHALVRFGVPHKERAAWLFRKSVPAWCINWAHLIDDTTAKEALERLIPEKRRGTEAFFKYIRSLSGGVNQLEKPVGDVMSIRTLGTRFNAIIKTCNASGDAVDPPQGSQITFAMHGVV